MRASCVVGVRWVLALALAVAAGSAAAANAERLAAYRFEEGVSSWYGGKFHGRRTASGEVYDENGMTAAHRTLPFGTVLLVTNLGNDRTARVRVTDRGPFVKGRILDCSKGAARALDFEKDGLARVRLEILGRLPSADDSKLKKKRDRNRLRKALRKAAGKRRWVKQLDRVATAPPELVPPPTVVSSETPTTPPRPVSAPPAARRQTGFAVQVGAFSDAGNAARFALLLREGGFRAFVHEGADGLHRVRVGPLDGRVAAEREAERVRAAGHAAHVVPPAGGQRVE